LTSSARPVGGADRCGQALRWHIRHPVPIGVAAPSRSTPRAAASAPACADDIGPRPHPAALRRDRARDREPARTVLQLDQLRHRMPGTVEGVVQPP
jgi:hypothetical protein